MKDRSESSQQLRFSQMPSRSEDYIDSVLNMSADDVERLRAFRPKKLGIVCGRSECKEQLHSFRRPPSKASLPPGLCQACGAKVVSWDLMHVRDLTDVSFKIDSLKTEWIRHFFFNLPITPRVEQFAGTKGLAGLESVAHDQLSQSKMLNFNPDWDWNQTKMLDGNIVHWARHAMGCCCRRCLAYWHNVPLEATLSASDIEYFRSLLMVYINSRVPSIGGNSQMLGSTSLAVAQLREAV
jgi:Domain of unknown function (DUF4186)